MLAAICLFSATSCRRSPQRPVPARPDSHPAPLTFQTSWGTDLSSDGALSGPAAIVRLDDGSLIVLDRFNNRIQHYSPKGSYLGRWGNAPGGKPFPFTFLVDIARDPQSGNIIAGVINRITDRDLNSLRGGMFPADTLLRFSQKGDFKGKQAIVNELLQSPARDEDFIKITNDVFWNRNELLPFSIFGRLAPVAEPGSGVWQVLNGPPSNLSPDGATAEVPLTKEDGSPAGFCEIETGPGGWVYLGGCLQRADIRRAKISDILKRRFATKLFIRSPEKDPIKLTADTRADMFKSMPDGSFVLYMMRKNIIYKFTPSGAPDGEIAVKPRVYYASGIEHDGNGGFYICDYVADRVLHISPRGDLISTFGTRRNAPGQFAGRSFSPFLAAPGAEGKARPAGVVGLAVDEDGNVYASDADNRRIQKFNSAGKFIAQFPVCQGEVDCRPADLLFSNNTLYAALHGAHAVLRLDPRNGKKLAYWKPQHPSPTAVCSICGIGPGGHGSILATDGESIFKFNPDLTPDPKWNTRAFKTERLTNPNDIAASPDGGYYAAGTKGPGLLATASAVCKYSSSSKLETCFPIKNLYHPRSIITAGNSVFVSNSGKDTVLMLNGGGLLLGQWGGEGRAPGMFQNPLGLAASRSSLFVADNGNERIQKFKISTP